MQDKNNRTMYILLAVAALAVIGGIITLFTWGTGTKATPTVSLDAIYTSAAQTVSAQQATLQASNPPTLPPPPTFPIAPPPTSGVPLPVPTLGVVASPTTGVVAGCDNSVFVKDVTIPDGTIMSPGQVFTKTWVLQNSGSCTWDTNYKFAFASGDVMSGVTTGLPYSVPPGQQLEISVKLTTPADAGNYKGFWRLMNAGGTFFGNSPWVAIKVVAPTETPTPTLPAP